MIVYNQMGKDRIVELLKNLLLKNFRQKLESVTSRFLRWNAKMIKSFYVQWKWDFDQNLFALCLKHTPPDASTF